MMTGMLTRLNFLDFIILIVLFRICYVAAKTGLAVEIFKVLGVIFSTYFGLHYYTVLSDFIHKRFLPDSVPLEFIDFIVLVLLITAGYLCFVLLRGLLCRFIQLDAVPKINQIGGLILGVGRSFLVVGLLAFTLSISTVGYFSNAVKSSYLGSQAFSISPATYGWLWNNIFSKFSGQEKFNSTVTETMEKFKHK